ncbi:sugar kinase [Parvularcula sp. LCG005]|uniref:sugar kinase n=1 Tax=Parvularcula sp. LCG005 TaxID=3078805 RepID=UPI002943F63C|nr:sugar kinase [Parvularcula sp. LCG005]WOI53469.1 sugar kinase [Parvularcula sp. LCG005]
MSGQSSRIVVMGECMLELSGGLGGDTRLAYAGDTLNTALYLARAGLTPDYVTALGEDPYSAEIIEGWRAEGIGADHVLRHPTRVPGLYAIRTDDEGERHFYYWRENSAARAFFQIEGQVAAVDHAAKADWLYFSGITLSIFDAAGRQRLKDIAASVKSRGGQVVFDPNYRARGWSSAGEAREAIRQIADTFTLVLPTFDDDAALFGDASVLDCAHRWQKWGAARVLVKDGPRGCTIVEQANTTMIPVEQIIRPKDTTGAGDSFNGSFLGQLISGAPLEIAAIAGNRTAATVIQHPGAIIPRAAMPDLSAEALYAVHKSLSLT